MSVIGVLRKIILKEKADSKSYIEYLRKKGAEVGEDVTIYSPNKTYIDEQFPFMLSIGDHVNITTGCHILNHDYSWAVGKRKFGQVFGGVGEVCIGNNVFIGVNSVILMNTHIGDNVIIGAGSVVKGLIPSNTVVAGVPAKPICSLDDYWKNRENSQYEEAVNIVKNYRKRFGKNPPKEMLPAYFFLFEERDNISNPIFTKRMKLCGNYDESLEAFLNYKQMFDSYEAFLNSIDN